MRRFAVLAALALLAGCAPSRVAPVAPGSAPAADATVAVTLLQLNDVYEITPVEGGRTGGMARVATVRERLRAENPNTYTVMAGDFFSPSALGTARVDGERLNGRQMVAVLNAVGLDLAAFGNHEFDLNRDDFLKRVAESRFAYVSSNVTDAAGAPFPNSSRTVVRAFGNARGDSVRVGFVSATLPSNPKEWVAYAPEIASLRSAVAELRGRADVIVALTHLALEQDEEVAAVIPEIDLVLGGHEHENVRVFRGARFTPVVKADANARSVYVHRLRFDPRSRGVSIHSELVPVTDAIPEEPRVAAEVRGWVERAYAGFRESGFAPEAPVATTTEALDGREATIRNGPTNLGVLIAEAMRAEAGAVDLALMNSGSVRIDDVLPAGLVTQYDVIRVLPFGGSVLTVSVRGDVLRQALEQGLVNRGSGGFLQTWGVERGADGGWRVGGEPLRDQRSYRVATSDFLVSGRETGLTFFNAAENPGMTVVATHRDIRMALIDELRRRYGAPRAEGREGAVPRRMAAGR